MIYLWVAMKYEIDNGILVESGAQDIRAFVVKLGEYAAANVWLEFQSETSTFYTLANQVVFVQEMLNEPIAQSVYKIRPLMSRVGVRANMPAEEVLFKEVV